MAAPVTNEASSEQSQTTSEATSSGDPSRPTGRFAIQICSMSGHWAARLSVVLSWFGWQERFDRLPQIVADQVRCGHGRAYPDRRTVRENPLRFSWRPH
jgi:hypothetical protein